MLKEIGVEWVILGHSERRQYFGETDETVNAKMLQVLKNDMTPIVCVGETLEQYEAGTTKDVVKTQVVAAYKDVCPKCASRSVIAYEPVWAIGTGKTATNEIAQDVCGYIRSVVAELYGQEVADTFVGNSSYIHGRRKQTAYNISGDCHSDVRENCLSPVLSDFCIALKTHSNPCQPKNTFHKKSASRGKNAF